MTHAFLTIAIPFDSEYRQDLESLLDAMGNPPAAGIKERLDATNAIHFMSIHAVHCPSAERDRLVIEATADGGPSQAIEAIAGALGPELRRLLVTAEVDIGSMSLEQVLTIYALDVGPRWRQTLGLTFDGSPTLSVRRINEEHRLATRILAEKHAVLAAADTPAKKLETIRNWLWNEGEKWAFEAEPTPFLRGGIERTLPVKIRVAASACLHMLGPGLLRATATGSPTPLPGDGA
jgi:hypothetical protein